MNFHLILQNKHLTRNKEKWNYNYFDFLMVPKNC